MPLGYPDLTDDLKNSVWKEQIQGLLGAQELPEARKVDIVLGALAGEAKRQISVLEEGERDQTRKVFFVFRLLIW